MRYSWSRCILRGKPEGTPLPSPSFARILPLQIGTLSKPLQPNNLILGGRLGDRGLERFDTPDDAGGPVFLSGEAGTPDGENLGTLVDAFETLLGLGNGLNRCDPEFLHQWRM